MNKLGVKLLLNGIAVVPFLVVFTEATWLEAALTSILLSIIAYGIGDLLIYRKTNNTIATIADVGLAYLFLGMAAAVKGWSLSGTELLTLSLAIGILEVFFHMYMRVGDEHTTSA